jgi:hypothetical protein
MSPVGFTPEKECYTVLILQSFRERVSQPAMSGGPAILVLGSKGKRERGMEG